MNPYLKNLNKIEFVVTYACTGRCKHCSEGEHSSCGESIDPNVAAEAVRKIADMYRIKTVMTFGGEPLLYPNTVFAIINAARSADIPRRQVITNGYFTKNDQEITRVVGGLADCGVNDLLLSVDAFHQETIPVDRIKIFAAAVKDFGIPMRLQPAWLVSPEDKNPYNLRTREILDYFLEMGIPESEGNVVFPEGNAVKYLASYFTDNLPENPYRENPRDMRCLSFSPNGDVLFGNIYKRDIMDILNEYC